MGDDVAVKRANGSDVIVEELIEEGSDQFGKAKRCLMEEAFCEFGLGVRRSHKV